jgi:hypothetical protein
LGKFRTLLGAAIMTTSSSNRETAWEQAKALRRGRRFPEELAL